MLANNKKSFYKNVFVFFIGSSVANALNYLFNMLASRTMSPSDYGIVASLLSVSLIALVPAGAITLLVVKYSSSILKNEDRDEAIASLLYALTKYALAFVSGLFIAFVLFRNQLAVFLKINNSYAIIMLGIFVFVTFLAPITRGLMQVLEKFGSLSLNLIIEAFAKVLLGIGLVLLGYSANGAITGVVIAGLLGYATSFLPIKRYVGVKVKPISLKPILINAAPVLAMTFAITLFYNIDTVLAKHFLSPDDAGHYVALALLGKIIFFTSTSITAVMYAKTSNLQGNNKESTLVLARSIILIVALSSVAIFVYYFFPNQAISYIVGSKYSRYSDLLWYFGAAAGLLSIINSLANYFVSKGNNSASATLLIAVAIQVILISLFNDSVAGIITASIAAFSVLFLMQSLYLVANVLKMFKSKFLG